MKCKTRGFTLIELMIVVMVVAILSAIAIPSYQDYALRARVTQAIAWLSGAQAKMEQCYQDNHAYKISSGVDCCTSASAGNVGDFTGSCAANANDFTLTATGNSASTTGFVYTVNQVDGKTTSVSGHAGWNSGNCWITKKGQTC
jgi:type IV pilus assembly protein PilE